MSHFRRTILLWTAAIAAVVATGLAMPAAFAAYAAPNIDTTVPTGTYNEQCVSGMLADVLCLTDNASVTYYMDSSGEYELEAEDRSAVVGALARYRDNTVLTVTYDSSPVFSGGGETDVIYQEGAFGLPDYVRGITWCNDPVDGTRFRCDQHYIRIRGAGTYNERVAGHESGHAFGETHGAQASPVQGQCAGTMGIMRADLECIDSAALGDVIRNNINYNYQ